MKLSSLKEWMTVAEAATYLKDKLTEEVAEADVLRLGLDGHLRLSVYFVNGVMARRGKVIHVEDVNWKLVPSLNGTGMRLQKEGDHIQNQTTAWQAPPKFIEMVKEIPVDELPNWLMLPDALDIDGDRYLELSDSVTSLRGVWDLPMIGNERLDIEHKFQMLTGGPAVSLVGLDGAFVEGSDGEMCQLQETYGENEFPDFPDPNCGKDQLKVFLDKVTQSPTVSYFPAGRLPDDAVIVVRHAALCEFEKHVNDAPLPTSRAHVSDKLATLNQAAARFWEHAKRDERDTHPDNATVAAWLVERGFTQTLADKAATIIRPEWAPPGRKPEK